MNAVASWHAAVTCAVSDTQMLGLINTDSCRAAKGKIYLAATKADLAWLQQHTPQQASWASAAVRPAHQQTELTVTDISCHEQGICVFSTGRLTTIKSTAL